MKSPFWRAVAVVAVAFVGALLGCRDGTAPDAGVTVTVTASQPTPPVVSIGVDSLPVIECAIDLQATATGTGRATWLDATLKFYAGRDRTRPEDTTVFAAADVQNAWGGAEIQSGETQLTGLIIAAGIPFAITLDFRYRTSAGSVRTASVSFTCGLSVPTNGRPPAILSVSVANPVDSIEPGDTLGIQYSVSGQIALWVTLVELSGPCRGKHAKKEFPRQRG